MPEPSEPRLHSPAARHPRSAAAIRVEELRGELTATSDRPRRALLHYELAHVLEHLARDTAAAVREYAAGFNVYPKFRPPLFALVRLCEQRGSVANLERLYRAEARAARHPREQADALVDLAAFLTDEEEDNAGSDDALRQALEIDPAHRAGLLMLEYEAWRRGDRELARRALEYRTQHTQSPVLRALLLAELAEVAEQAGNVDAAVTALRTAARLGARTRMLRRLEQVARRHERWHDCLEALDGQVELATNYLEGHEEPHSGPYRIERFEQEDDARQQAASLLWEASRLCSKIGDAAGASSRLRRAMNLLPSDLALRFEAMHAEERAGDLDAVARIAHSLIEEGAPPAVSAGLHFRLAEAAQARGEMEACRASLDRAAASFPQGVAAQAMLDDVLIDLGDNDARVAVFSRTAVAGQSARQRMLAATRAADLLARHADYFEAALAQYRAAIEQTDQARPLLRELYAAALRHGRTETAVTAATELLPLVERDEAEVLAWQRYTLLRDELGRNDDADRALEDALSHPSGARWAAGEARLLAASSGDAGLLARAHHALAELAPHGEAVAAHLCAAARAEVRLGQRDAATSSLRAALRHAPGHPYALTLLRELLQAAGAAADVLDLLREQADREAGARADELSIMLAGAAAEARGDLEVARRSYESARERAPTASTPLLALRRLALRQSQADVARQMTKALSEREVATGKPGLATLEYAERLAMMGEDFDEALAALRELLDEDVLGTDLGIEAAIQVLTLPTATDGLRVEALNRLLRDADEEDRKWLEEAIIDLTDAPDEEEPAAVSSHRRDLSVLLGPSISTDDVDAWLSLGRKSGDPDIMLAAMRAFRLGTSDDVTDDAFIIASEIAEEAPGSAAAVVALDETLSAGDDPEAFAEALEAGATQVAREGRSSLLAAAARALIAAGSADDAVKSLQSLVEENPLDYASWEALRVAARQAKDWDHVVRACEALAHGVDGVLRGELLAEAGAVLMDHLRDDSAAEQRFRQALDLDITIAAAFDRLHDLLAERGDEAGILTLIDRRIEKEEDSSRLERLFYEKARLHRSASELREALHALEQLLVLNEHHVGGLALASEIFVALHEFQGAVDALRALAEADVPDAQRRLARLGAANFLADKLGRPHEALGELEYILELGLGDHSVAERVASLSEELGDHSRASAALIQAAEMSEGNVRADYARHAGDLLSRLMRPKDAIAQYRKAVEANPSDAAATRALADLLEDEQDKASLTTRFEQHIRQTQTHELSTVRPLLDVAHLRGDVVLERAVLELLVALGCASDIERTRWEEVRVPIPLPTTSSARGIDVRVLGWDSTEPWSIVAQAIGPTLNELDRRTARGLGLGRRELVSNTGPNPLREELTRLAGVLTLSLEQLYIDPRRPQDMIVSTISTEGLVCVIGKDVRSPFSPVDRFLFGQKAMAARCGMLGLIERTTDEAATVLLAALAAADSAYDTAPRADLAAWTQALARALPRKAKREIATVSSRLARAESPEEACDRFRLVVDRAGLLLCWSLEAALQVVLSEAPTPEILAMSPDAQALVDFWLSTAAHDAIRSLELV